MLRSPTPTTTMTTMAAPAPLPTPPNSTKTKVEHCFEEHLHDHDHSSDAPLFDHARSERGTSPTDFLFSHREGRHSISSPPNPQSLAYDSPKRLRSDENDKEDDSSRKAMRFSRSPSPKPQAEVEPLPRVLEPSTKFQSQPIHLPKPSLTPLGHSNAGRQNEQTPRYPRLSDSERDLVTDFHHQFSKLPIRDYGQEGWFVQRHDPVTKTWAQPLFDLKTPPPLQLTQKFTPINAYELKPKSMKGIVYSVELPDKAYQPLQKKPVKASRAPRKRLSTTPTHGSPNTKAEARSTRNPANKPLSSKNFRDYPNYAPAIASSNSSEALRLARNIPQMSGSKDLSADPLRHELSEAEVIAAQKAGMDCARYLCTKRAVFVGYVKHLRYAAGKYDLSPEDVKKGLKSWNKTAAQGCSGIDVNKTSALWAGFWQPMGWFDKEHFKGIIQQPEVYFPKFDKDGNVVPQYDSQGQLMH